MKVEKFTDINNISKIPKIKAWSKTLATKLKKVLTGTNR